MSVKSRKSGQWRRVVGAERLLTCVRVVAFVVASSGATLVLGLLGEPRMSADPRRVSDTDFYCAGQATGCSCDGVPCAARWQVSCTNNVPPCVGCVRCRVSLEIHCGAAAQASTSLNVGCTSSTPLTVAFCSTKACTLKPRGDRKWCEVSDDSHVPGACSSHYDFTCSGCP